MSAGHSSTSLAGFVAEPSVKIDVAARRRLNHAQALQDRLEHHDAVENGLRRRARRQGLTLMIASSLLSILVLYGIWTLLSGGI